jgi:DNA-directed RNA polymerase subunit beta
MYEAIVKGENILEPGMPESFNVLMQELKALALNVELVEQPQEA